jgi:hypothetical protein
MSAPSIWVRRDVQLDAAKKLRDNNPRDAVDLLLNSDLSFEDNGLNAPDKVDAGSTYYSQEHHLKKIINAAASNL